MTERIRGSAHPLIEATAVMQEAIRERIDLLASKTTYKARYRILMGAILINGDHDMGSFTAVRRLSATNLATGESEDLLAELMG